MKRTLLIAALAVTALPVQAQPDVSFMVDGQSVRIAVPHRCGKPPCVSLSVGGNRQTFDGDQINAMISGFLGDGGLGGEADVGPDEQTVPVPGHRSDAQEAEVKPATPSVPQAAKAESVSSLPATPSASPPVATTPEAAPPPSTEPRPTQQASTTATPAPPAGTAAAPVEPSPLGVWVTQNREGRVRIVKCGDDYCGYAVDDHSNGEGPKVLIGMKAVAATIWSGTVRDPRGGGLYSATMTLANQDALTVRGCAFGGYVCQSQNWTRG